MAKKATKDPDKRPNEMADKVQFWFEEIASARKREKDWRKQGQEIIEVYEGAKSETTPFNILYSNTETMLPSLYSAIPRPVVQRRYKDEDPMGLAAARAGQRILEFLIDTNVEGYETFNEAMKSATLDGILPGRGVTTIKYDVEMGEMPPPDGSPPETDPTPIKVSELVCPESRNWNRVFLGFARKWSRVPWIAYEEHLDKDECKRLFGDEIASQITFTEGEDDGEEAGDKSSSADDREQGKRKTALVYQIWDKEGGRQVRYITESYKDNFLLVQDDPLKLTGFFNCPRPLTFIEKSHDLMPVALYTLYENQARELNRLTVRINRVTEAIKVRGAYDSAMGTDIANIMKGDDNELVPAERSSSIAYEKGLQNAIWLWPLDTLMAVLEKLMVAREQTKQTIYEIMGIADIMRGASKASETLGAQQIKAQWGTLRIKPKQYEVQRYARDLLRIMLEVAATKFDEDTWARMTGLPFITSQRKEQLMMVAQAAQMSGQQLDPQTQAELQKPVWADVLAILNDDMQRAYRIDIETNSTVEPEAAEDQQQIAELLTAVGQFITGVGPLVEKGVMPFEVAKTMMLTISKRFRFGAEIEDELKQMKEPEKDNSEAEAAQQQAQQAQGQAQQAQQATQAAEGKVQQLTMQLKETDAQRTMDKQAADLALRELQLKSERALFDLEQAQAKESLQLRDQVGMEKLQHKGEVVSIKEAQAKREQATVARSESKMGEGLSQVRNVGEAMSKAEEKILTALQTQGEQTQQMVMAILQAIKAPRVRVPVRGKDGRIVKVIDGPDEQEQTLQ